MQDLRISIVLNDAYSSKMRSIASGTERSLRSIQRDIRKTGQVGNSLDSLNNKLDFLEKKRRLSLDITEMRAVAKEIEKVNSEIDLIERKAGMRKGGKGGVKGMAGKLGIAGIAAGAAVGGFAFGKDITETSAKYERFEAVLKNTYGSADEARKGMANISNFAAKTPFQIDELTDSFIKLENAGMQPSMTSMRQMGDLAASRGKSFEMLSEAMLDATMGEFERLKEFGIKGRTENDKYIFSFKNVETAVKKNGTAVRDYILSLGNLQGVQGGMAGISKTTGGQISNLADSWDQLKAAMGSSTSGPLKNTIGAFTNMANDAKAWFTVPLSQKIAEEKVGLNALVSIITSHNTSNTQRIRLMNQLKEQYPDFLGDLDAESAKNADLLKRLDDVNASYDRRIKLQSQTELKDYATSQKEKYEQMGDRASVQMKLLKEAESGDSTALSLMRKNMTPAEKFDYYMLQSVFDDEFTKLRYVTRWQVSAGKRGAKKYAKEEKKYMGAQKSAELTDFMFENESAVKKLSGTELEQYNSMQSQLLSTVSDIDKYGLTRSMRGGTYNYGSEADTIVADMKKLLGLDVKNETDFGGGGGKSSGAGLGSGVDSITGDNRIAKNLTINIQELGNDMQIHTTTLKEATPEIRRAIFDSLLTAVNDVNGS